MVVLKLSCLPCIKNMQQEIKNAVSSGFSIKFHKSKCTFSRQRIKNFGLLAQNCSDNLPMTRKVSLQLMGCFTDTGFTIFFKLKKQPANNHTINNQILHVLYSEATQEYMWVALCMCVCVYTHTYIYTYIQPIYWFVPVGSLS